MKNLYLFLLALTSTVHSFDYLSEEPVKLLTATLFGDLYRTADSEYRTFSSGEDHEISLSAREEANQMPTEQLVLPPGGRAVYNLPMTEDLLYLMVKPGKREEGSGSPFSDKANITLSATWSEDSDGVSVDCHQTSHDGSADADHYCTLDLEPLKENPEGNLLVTVSVPSEETRTAFLWQLHLSPLDDSERVMATFMEKGRQLMRKTQENEASNTFLTMVSIVGNTGVGKSTVASLLSGNETMFKAKASSSGTTTIGADISTIIPGYDFAKRMEEVLEQGPLYEPPQSRPLFLIDSEGMSFRGDEVDFVTTGPVAIIANIIIWITTGRIRPPQILEQVGDYMKGLDRITMGDESSEEQAYGEFIIVLNMMQVADQGSSDEEIFEELFAWGSSPEEDAIREQMSMRFKDIVCIGLPTMELEEGEHVGYEVLKRYPRFQEGLTKLGNRILVESETALDVKVGDNTYEMNSTEAETIIGMLIDGANQGNIDLSDFCNVVYSMNKQKVIQELGLTTTQLQDTTKGKCINETQSCTACVCDYRNNVVKITIEKIEDILLNAMEEAELLCGNRPDVMESIASITKDMVEPWTALNRCNAVEDNLDQFSEHCDISEMVIPFNQAGEEVHMSCDSLFLCGSTVIDADGIHIISNSIYVAENTKIETADLGRAKDGENGASPGEDGGDGKNGKPAGMVIINSEVMLKGSYNSLRFNSKGQSGGHGGHGASGVDNTTGFPPPPSKEQIVMGGVIYDENHWSKTHCHVHHCHCDHDQFFFKKDIEYKFCGGEGGKGGNGGNGGAAGFLTMLGASGVLADNLQLPSNGGEQGLGGDGGSGKTTIKEFKALKYRYETTSCGMGSGWSCSYDQHEVITDEGSLILSQEDCPGSAGDNGKYGEPWETFSL